VGNFREAHKTRICCSVRYPLRFVFAACGVISAFAPHFRQTFLLSATQTALLIAVPVLLGSLARIPMGMLADRFGGRMVFTSPLGQLFHETGVLIPENRLDQRTADTAHIRRGVVLNSANLLRERARLRLSLSNFTGHAEKAVAAKRRCRRSTEGDSLELLRTLGNTLEPD
jgi:hypothetical protein